MNDKMRDVGTGATRTADTGRYDPEGFLSPAVLERFCEYMNKHRTCADGSIRASDNWQKGMPKSVWIKGIWRHFLHLWTRHRGHTVRDAGATRDAQEDCCALMFGVMGYLSELLKDEAVIKRASQLSDTIQVFAGEGRSTRAVEDLQAAAREAVAAGVDPDLIGELSAHDRRSGLQEDHSLPPDVPAAVCAHGYTVCAVCDADKPESYGGTTVD